QFARIAEASDEDVVDVMRSVYQEPIRPELIRDRLQQLRDAGVTAAGSLSPQRTQEHWRTVVDAGVDLFFIRGTTVSAEHVSSNREPLNLKRFIYELDVPVIVGGCATYTAALHLMRTGAAGVLVGFGGGASQTTEETLGISVPLAGAVADVAAARRDYMDESGGRYVHVIADGGLGRSGDLVKAIACGADGLMVGAALARAQEAPGHGHHWGSEAHHPTLTRGHRVSVGTVAPLEQILFGPSIAADGTTNPVGALRHAMATTGYLDPQEFQRAEVVAQPCRSPGRPGRAAGRGGPHQRDHAPDRQREREHPQPDRQHQAHDGADHGAAHAELRDAQRLGALAVHGDLPGARRERVDVVVVDPVHAVPRRRGGRTAGIDAGTLELARDGPDVLGGHRERVDGPGGALDRPAVGVQRLELDRADGGHED